MDLRPLWPALPFALAAACASTTEKQHAPLVDCGDCPGPTGATGGGKPNPFGGGGASGSGGGTSGASGAGGGSGGAVAGVTASGSVIEIITTDFQQSIPYTMTVDISASSANPNQPTTTTVFDGKQPFHVPNVKPGLVWLRTAPTATNALGAWALVSVDGKAEVTLPVVERAVLVTILGTLPSQQPLGDANAHVAAVIVDAMGAPVVGATVTADVSATIVYDDGPGYADTQTHARGVVLLLNTGTPTKTTTLSITTKDGKAFKADPLPIDKATVTLAKVTLQLRPRAL